jgi:hypothetical protein
MTVAALYIDPRGPYPKLLGPELCWDEQRDARNYVGGLPVVAHPPCGPWGRLRRFCTRQQADLGPIAVEQVRANGGVLEHPADSRLWAHCGMPKPGEFPDAWGGRTVVVDQVDWGHPARKRTWLYLVGVHVLGPRRAARQPTHVVASSLRRLPEMLKRERHITPPAFAEWLISLAEQAGRTGARRVG